MSRIRIRTRNLVAATLVTVAAVGVVAPVTVGSPDAGSKAILRAIL